MQADVEHEVFTRLTPVCKRQRRRAVLQAVGHGLLYGAALAAVLGLASLALWAWPLGSTGLPEAWGWLVRWAVLPGLAVAGLLVGPSAGAWFALRREADWHAAAAAVDRHYHLHDRALTAVAFLEKPDRKPLEEIQIADAAERLAQVDPRAVVPVGLPRPLPAALLLSALSVAAIVGPLAVEPSTRPALQPEPEATTAIRPTDREPSPDAAAMGARLAAEVHWQVAPAGDVRGSRADVLAGATLEEIISGTDKGGEENRTDSSGRGADLDARKPAAVVLEGEPLPLKHRRAIRRYFESIHPTEYELPKKPAGSP